MTIAIRLESLTERALLLICTATTFRVHNQRRFQLRERAIKILDTCRISTLKTADSHLQTLPLIQMMPNKEKPHRVSIIYTDRNWLFLKTSQ